MTDKTAPIIDIRHVVYWAEIDGLVGKELKPVANEFQFARLGYDLWERIETVNIVPQHLLSPENKSGVVSNEVMEKYTNRA
jgi:hypothetical protein